MSRLVHLVVWPTSNLLNPNFAVPLQVPLFLRSRPTSYEQHHRQARFILAYLFRRFTGVLDFDVIRCISHRVVAHPLALFGGPIAEKRKMDRESPNFVLQDPMKLPASTRTRIALRWVLKTKWLPNLDNGCEHRCLQYCGIYAQCPWCKACCCVAHAPLREGRCCEEAAKAKYSWLFPARCGMPIGFPP